MPGDMETFDINYSSSTEYSKWINCSIL